MCIYNYTYLSIVISVGICVLVQSFFSNKSATLFNSMNIAISHVHSIGTSHFVRDQ